MSHLVHGQNGLAAEERVAKIRDSLDPSGLSTSLIDAASVTANDLRATLGAAPFFGGQRIVVIRGPASLNPKGSADDSAESDPESDLKTSGSTRLDWRDVVAGFAAMPASTDAICWVSGTIPSNHALSKFAKDSGWVIDAFKIPRGPELLAWVSDRAASLGGSIDSNAVEPLLDLLYPTVWRSETRWDSTLIDMRLIATEIEKLICASKNGRIDRSLVADLVADRGGYTAFRLNEVIISGAVSGALCELDRVLGAGEPAERVLGQITGEISLLASVRVAKDAPTDQLATAAGATTGRIDRSRRRAGRVAPSTIAAVALALRDADLKVKTGRAPDAATTIVPLVAELAGLFSRSTAGGAGAGRR